MDLREQAVIELMLETKKANTELAGLEANAKTLNSELKKVAKTVGEGSDEWKAVKAQADEASKAVVAHRLNVDASKLTYGQLQNLVKQLTNDVKGLVPGTDAFNDAVKRLNAAEDQLKKVNTQVKGTNEALAETSKPTLWNNITGGIGKMSTLFQGFIGLQVVQFLWDMGKAIFDITAKFEKYEKVLETALGGQKEAKAAMEAIKIMAANTAFSVDELTEGYVKMVNRGLRPTQKEMVSLSDLAASQGKTFDQLVEAVLDAQTAEFTRLKEFGINAKKEGDNISLSFKGQTQVVKNNEEAILAAIVAMGAMTGVAGQNAKMMETLGGKTSNLGDNFDSLMVTLGTGLRPVFVAILDLLNASIPVLLFVGQTIGTVVVAAKSLIMGMVDTVKNGGMAIVSLAEAVTQVSQGNLAGAKLSLDNAVDYGNKTLTSMNSNIQQGVKETIAIWKDPTAEIESKFAAKRQGEAHWKTLNEEQKKGFDEQVRAYKSQGITLTDEQKNTLAKQIKAHEDFNINLTDDQKKSLEERKAAQKKHLEEVQKANEDAVAQLKDLNQELYLDHVKRTKGELEASREKLRLAYEDEVEAVNKSVASKSKKDELIAALEKKYQNDLTDLTEQQSKTRAEIVERWVEDEFVKKIKKAQDFANSEKKRIAENIADEKERTELIQKVEKWLDDEVRGIKKEKADKEAEQRADDLKKEQELADKKLNVEKTLNEQERAANKALFDWRELTAKGNANKLAEIKKEQLAAELKYLLEKLRIEEAEERAKAERDITNSDQLGTAIKNIEDRFRNERLTAEKKTADEIKQVEKELKEARNARWKEGSDGIKALLEGDLSGFVGHMGNIVKGEKSAWQERLSENMEKYEAVAQLAQAAVAFLKKLSEERLKRELADIEKEKTAKIAAEEAKTEATIDAIEAQRDAELDRVEQELLANQLEKKELTELNDSFTKAKQKVELEYQAKIKEARDKGNKEEVARLKAEQAEKIATVKSQITQDALGAEKATAIEKQLTADKKVVNDKYNASILSAKKSQENSIDNINKQAAEKEKAAKMKAWQAQQKADIASAIIAGALATIKALASGFFPVNLVFAAATAIATGIQVAMIKRQPAPTFSSGGMLWRNAGVLRGASHQQGGIDMIDNTTGQKVAEVENKEAYIVSSPVTDYHRDTLNEIINQSLTGRPAPLRRRGNKKRYAIGGAFKPEGERPFWEKNFYQDGRPSYDDNNEFSAGDSGANSYGSSSSSSDGGDYSAGSSGDGGINVDEAKAAGEAARQQGENQLKLLEEIARNTKETNDTVRKLGDKVNETTSAVRGVEGAVRGQDQSWRLDNIVNAISNLGGK